jgi:glycosyltransferase involved in cell wall biosynthesis
VSVDPRPTVSFVIPAYNEEANIEEVVRRSLIVLDQCASDGEVVVVVDGSLDSTASIVARLVDEFPGRLRSIVHSRPIGCHPSMWRGSLAARYEWIFFIPADKQIVPEELPNFLAASADADLVCSYRRTRADQWYRRLVGRIYNLLERTLLSLDLDDTHSSVLIRKSVVEAIAPDIRSTSAVLPVEIAARAMHHGFRILQIQIAHYPRVAGVATGITSKDILRLPGDLIRFTFEIRTIRRSARAQRATHSLR